MTIDQLREVRTTTPFQPYHLQLADGKEVDVLHPECLAYFPRNPRTISVAMPNGVIKIIDLLLVASIETGNGRSSRRRGRR